MCEICSNLTKKAPDQMCGTKRLQMSSFSIILTSLHSFNYHFHYYSMSFLLLYLSFHLDSLHCLADSPHFPDFHPDFLHTHPFRSRSRLFLNSLVWFLQIACSVCNLQEFIFRKKLI